MQKSRRVRVSVEQETNKKKKTFAHAGRGTKEEHLGGSQDEASPSVLFVPGSFNIIDFLSLAISQDTFCGRQSTFVKVLLA